MALKVMGEFLNFSVSERNRLRFSTETKSVVSMSSLLLPADVALRPKSLALLHEIGVKIFIEEGGNRLEFPVGVSQVVSCVLETEKPFLADAVARVYIDKAIATIGGQIVPPDLDIKTKSGQTEWTTGTFRRAKKLWPRVGALTDAVLAEKNNS